MATPSLHGSKGLQLFYFCLWLLFAIGIFINLISRWVLANVCRPMGQFNQQSHLPWITGAVCVPMTNLTDILSFKMAVSSNNISACIYDMGWVYSGLMVYKSYMKESLVYRDGYSPHTLILLFWMVDKLSIQINFR